jgi:deoxyadenosine/deoxycytidine kinase
MSARLPVLNIIAQHHFSIKMIGKIIALEGQIGVGKSTLCSKLKVASTNITVYEEQTNELFLKLFYSNPVCIY